MGKETFHEKLLGINESKTILLPDNKHIEPEEQEYINKGVFKEIIESSKQQESQEIQEEKEDDKDSSEDEEDSGSEEDDDKEDRIALGFQDEKGTISLAGMTKEEKKAHKARVKEEKREKRKTKMSKYDKKRQINKGKVKK